jgi:hypothetical protein
MTIRTDEMSYINEEEVKLWTETQKLIVEEIKKRVSKETSVARNHPKFEQAWEIAWNEHRHNGLCEVEPLFKDILELLKP